MGSGRTCSPLTAFGVVVVCGCGARTGLLVDVDEDGGDDADSGCPWEAGELDVRVPSKLLQVGYEAVQELDVRDCTRATRASSLAERDGRVVLVDDAGEAILDCEGLPSSVGDERVGLYRAAFDLLLVERDGSLGLHAPDYAVRALIGAAGYVEAHHPDG